MSTPLDMETHTLNYVASERNWYSGSGSWGVNKWQTEFASWLDGEFGAGTWDKEHKYEATETTW